MAPENESAEPQHVNVRPAENSLGIPVESPEMLPALGGWYTSNEAFLGAEINGVVWLSV